MFTLFIARTPGHLAEPAAGLSVTEERSAPIPDAANLAHEVAVRERNLQGRLEENPDDAIARVQLARFYHDSHRPEEAIPHYRDYLEKKPDDREAWLDLVSCLGETGDWPAARDALESFLVRWPEDPAGRYNMGVVFANAGRTEEARLWWEPLARGTADHGITAMASASLEKISGS